MTHSTYESTMEVNYEMKQPEQYMEKLQLEQTIRLQAMQMAVDYSNYHPALDINIYEEAKRIYVYIMENKYRK